MKIYLDYIFIQNFLIDFILIKETAIISKQIIKNTNAVIASLTSSIYVIVMMYFRLEQLNYLICKFLLIIIMVFIAFKPDRLSKYLKITCVFLLVSSINVGTLIMLKQLLNIQEIGILTSILFYTIGLILSKFFITRMWKVYRQDIKSNNLIYDVKIKIGLNTYKYRAFLDTGNNVYSYTYNLPVLFASLKDSRLEKELKKLNSFEINTVTLSNMAKKKAYILDNIEVIKDNSRHLVKAAVVFENIELSKNNEYDMLLNYILFVEKLGGIKL